jgi:hypothetical protein
VALLAACAIQVAPASAQTRQPGWFVNGSIGPSFGTLGERAAGTVSGGYRANDWMSAGLEFGLLPRAEATKAAPVIFGAPLPAAQTSDVYVNKLHFNGNLYVHPPASMRVEPYATLGIGAASGLIRTRSAGVTLPADSRTVTNPAVNLGAGATLPLTNWLGITGDYRHFLVLSQKVQHVNRFLIGASLFRR